VCDPIYPKPPVTIIFSITIKKLITNSFIARRYKKEISRYIL